jgi:hypothetical protein
VHQKTEAGWGGEGDSPLKGLKTIITLFQLPLFRARNGQLARKERDIDIKDSLDDEPSYIQEQPLKH